MTFDEYLAATGLGKVDVINDRSLANAFKDFGLRSSSRIAEGTRHGEPMTLTLYLLDDPNFNAFAASFDDGDIIALNIGALPILRSVCRAFVSHGSVCPSVVTEGIVTEPISCPYSARDLLVGQEEWHVGPLVDPEREKVASWLLSFCFGYILTHEFAHIYNGHVDFLSQNQLFALIAELDENAADMSEGFERETLEWDADCVASQEMLHFVLLPETVVKGGKSTWKLPDSWPGGSFQETLVLGILPGFICSSLFSCVERSDPLDPSPRSHPHPLFRNMANTHMASSLLSYRLEQPEDRYEPDVKDAVTVAGATWRKVFTKKSGTNFDRPNEEYVDAYFSRLSMWTKTWEALVPELEQCARGGPLPTKISAIDHGGENGRDR